MQAAHFPHDLVCGPQMQVVGVGQLHLTADIFQILRAQRTLDGALGAHVHKYRGLDSAMSAGEHTPPRFPFRLFQLKHSYLT